MGMAASQARLLSITTRMSDNELRSQLINNQKMRLATESSQVSENYINALNEAQYMFTNYDENNKASYQELTFNSMTAYNEYNNQYGISNASGQILVSETDGKRFEEADGDLETFLKSYGLEYRTSYFEELENLYGTDAIKLNTENNIDGTTTTNYSRYNAAEIQEIYEGNQEDGGVHAGYENSMMSTAYNSYLKLEDTYLTAKENYDKVMEDVMREYANGFSVNVDGVGQQTYEQILNYVRGADTSKGIAYFYAFQELVSQMDDQDKFYKDANYEYVDMNGAVSYLSFGAYIDKMLEDCKYVNDTTKRYTTEVDYDGDVAYLDLNGDVVRVTREETSPGSGTYNYTYELVDDETGTYEPVPQDEDGEHIWDGNIQSGNINFYDEGVNTENIKFNFTWGNDKITVTETLLNGHNQDVYFNNLKNIIEYFDDAMVNAFDPSQFNDVAQGSANFQQYYNDYVAASQALSQFIFGTDVGFDNYANLSDYKWALDRGGTTADYQNVADVKAIDEVFNVYGEPKYAYIKEGDGDANADAEAEWYTNLFNRMTSGGYKVIENGLASSAEWMRYALESGLVKMEQVDKDNNWSTITFTSCSDITEQTNDVAVTIAEAEYNKAMNKIENKDKVYDMELKNIDTEHTALQTEYDSIKSALDKNVERNFKLYS